MKRSGSNTYFSLLHNLNITTMDEYEYEAAEILLKLPCLIAESESRFKWGATRKRSYTATSTTTLPSALLPSLQSQPSVPVTVVGPTPTTCCEIEKEKRPKALSPTTPLLLSPSESDEKIKPHPKRKVSLKRKKEEYLKMAGELTECNRTFEEEIKKIKSHYNQQKVLNLKLKAAKTERMIFDLEMQQPQTQLSLNRAMEPTSFTSTQGQHRQSQYMAHQQPFIMDQTTHIIQSSQYPPYGQTQNISFLSSNGGALFMINDDNSRVGPSLPLDLNIPLEESFTMECGKSDERRALAAQARQRRIQIYRSKTNNKQRSPFCR